MTGEPANRGREALAETRQAEAAFAAGQAYAGRAHLRRALELDPTRRERRVLLARLLAGAGMKDEALAEFDVLAADGEAPAPILAQAGSVLSSLGERQRSAAMFSRAVAEGGADAPAAWRIGWVNQIDCLGPPPAEIDTYVANRREAEQVLVDGMAALAGNGQATRTLGERLAQVRSQIARASANQAAAQGEAAFAAGDLATGAAELRRAIAFAPDRLDLRLRLVRVLAKAGRGEDCSAEVDRLAADPKTPPLVLAQCGEVEGTLGNAARAADLVSRAIATAGDEAPADWWGMWVSQLDRLALKAPGLAAFLDNRRCAKAMLRRALGRTSPDDAAKALLTHRLASVLWQLDDAGLATLADRVTSAEVTADGVREAALIAPILQDVTDGARLGSWLAAARQRHVNRLEPLRAQVSLSLGDKAALAHLWRPLLEAARAQPDDTALNALCGLAAYELGHWNEAFDRLSQAAARQQSIDLWWRAGQTALYRGRDADAEAAFGHIAERLPALALGTAAGALGALMSAVNHLYVLADVVDHGALAARLKVGLTELERWLAHPEFASPADLVDAAWELRMVRNEPYANLAMVPGQHGFITKFDARYGTLDLKAFAIVHHAIAEHEAALLTAAARGLAGTAKVGGLRVARVLPERLTDVLLELDRPAHARALLLKLRAQGWTGPGLATALARCKLQRDKAVHAELEAGQESASSHSIAYAHDWHEREGLTFRRVWREPGIAGVVERARLDGQVESFVHRTHPFSLDVTEVSGMEVRDSELVIGPRGSLLRPSDWHMISGVFPDRYGVCRAAARRGAILERQETRDIEEPVLVFAGADPVSVPNYYHWLIHQLARAVWALAQGWLEKRRLLVPEGSRSWMFQALRLAGIPDERMLLQPPEVAFRLADAWLVSSFEHPGASLIRAVRRRMWDQAGVSPETSPSRLVFLTRPLGVKAPAYDAAGIIGAVEATGFECVDPSELSIADQVRLLADARAVAGFDGAAMANLMFARGGAKVLDLTCEATHWPDFTGIAIALGLRFRYLSCAIPPPCRAPLFLNMAPVQCDLDLLERELRWAREP